jgi:two-component system, chemotaxis family, protein-glutamate methylesterase/glutaminase
MEVEEEEEIAMAVRVLIADSSGLARDIVRHHLECAGCEVVAEAQTASQAADLFRTVRPHLVALDCALPRIDGMGSLELFRTIRKEAPQTAVIVLGQSGAHADERMYLNEGALECLGEPLDHSGFMQIWRRLSSTYPELNRTRAEVGRNLQRFRAI